MLDLILGQLPAPKPPLVLGSPRELSLGERAALDEPRGITAAPLKELRQSHHNLARLLAQGLKAVEISSITGFSQSRISILKNDPAFKELVCHYTAQKDSAFADILGQLKSLSADALAELQTRLHDSPQDISANQLMALLELTLDRTGHAVTQKIQTTNVNISGEELVRIKALLANTGRVSQPKET